VLHRMSTFENDVTYYSKSGYIVLFAKATFLRRLVLGVRLRMSFTERGEGVGQPSWDTVQSASVKYYCNYSYDAKQYPTKILQCYIGQGLRHCGKASRMLECQQNRLETPHSFLPDSPEYPYLHVCTKSK